LNSETDDERWPNFFARPEDGPDLQLGTNENGAADSSRIGILGRLPAVNADDGVAAFTGTDPRETAAPSLLDDLLDVGGKVWTSPKLALGVVAGLAGIPFGGSLPRFEHGGVLFNNYPWGPGGAITLGDAILSTSPDVNVPVQTYAARSGAGVQNPIVNMGSHEEAHVHQADALGPLYLPVYAVQSLFSRGPSPMETAADQYGQTGKGWWPW
jgi:hypothetical protein